MGKVFKSNTCLSSIMSQVLDLKTLSIFSQLKISVKPLNFTFLILFLAP